MFFSLSYLWMSHHLIFPLYAISHLYLYCLHSSIYTCWGFYSQVGFRRNRPSKRPCMGRKEIFFFHICANFFTWRERKEKLVLLFFGGPQNGQKWTNRFFESLVLETWFCKKKGIYLFVPEPTPIGLLFYLLLTMSISLDLFTYYSFESTYWK